MTSKPLGETREQPTRQKVSRFDREIAYTSDAMAVASALALKYNHISHGLGRVDWLTNELQRLVPELFPLA